jgi:predicted ATP-grasp superfamily ATP-dependent carboligase
MRSSDLHLRALILDKRSVMGTEMCRSLARRGFAVDVLAEAGSPAFYSRFCARRLPAPPFDSGVPFLEVVRATIRANRYDAIFVCNEEVLEAFMTLPDYTQWPGLVLSARSSLETALSKFSMMRLAVEAGVLTPRSSFPRDEAELSTLGTAFGFPLIIKGDRGEAGNHVRLVREPRDLLSAYREIAALEADGGQSPLVQEYITGAAYSVGGLFHQGRALRLCAHRKLVGVPPLGGLTVRGVIDRNPELLHEACKIFEALEYSGLGHTEFIRDREGRFRFLEINPRVWGTIGIAEYAGVDLYGAYLQLARGEAPKPHLDFRTGVRFHRMAREGRTIYLKPSRIAGFIRDCLDPRVRSDFAWLDPVPHLAEIVMWRRKPSSPMPLRSSSVSSLSGPSGCYGSLARAPGGVEGHSQGGGKSL